MNQIKIVLFVALCSLAQVILAEVRLPKLISDGAVLQSDMELNIWGWASPGEQVEVVFKNEKYTAKTDMKGNWNVMLSAQQVGGPFEMTIEGSNKIVLQNIMIGEVWLCSGQSNMELTMQRVKDKYPEEIIHSKNAKIRQFLVPDQYDFNTPAVDFEGGSWMEANQENIENFSAVAYFFAKELVEKYGVAVGLINAALGGSPVEAWISENALKEFPVHYNELQKFKDQKLIQKIEKSDQHRQKAWYEELNKKDLGLKNGAEWFLEETDDSNWNEIQMPDFWSNSELGRINGVVWFRKKIMVPEQMAGKDAKLWLGRQVDQDHVYVNGKFVGTTGYQYPPRKYGVEKNLLKVGENTIVVRLINEQGSGGFIKDKPYFLAVGNDTIDLKGTWKYRLGAEMDPLQGPTFVRWKPGGLYNKMISPLLNYKIKGVIWYQGESNTSDAGLYEKTFPALINDWRKKWQLGDIPFVYVQLANFMEETNEPTESDWASLRQAQLNTLALPNTGMVVAIDLGEWNDIHPLNKKDVGKRLALQAEKLAYHETQIVASGPLPEKSEFSENKVEISFKSTGGELMAKNGKTLYYFELSADGKTFVKANAEIEGDKVVVSNPAIKNPKVVRYAWSDNPKKANLFSINGLPASPFQLKK